MFGFSLGARSWLLRHVSCQHRLPVDRHHWRTAWKLRTQGSGNRTWYRKQINYSPHNSMLSNTWNQKEYLHLHSCFYGSSGDGEPLSDGSGVRFLQQWGALRHQVHRKPRPGQKLQNHSVSQTYVLTPFSWDQKAKRRITDILSLFHRSWPDWKQTFPHRNVHLIPSGVLLPMCSRYSNVQQFFFKMFSNLFMWYDILLDVNLCYFEEYTFLSNSGLYC